MTNHKKLFKIIATAYFKTYGVRNYLEEKIGASGICNAIDSLYYEYHSEYPDNFYKFSKTLCPKGHPYGSYWMPISWTFSTSYREWKREHDLLRGDIATLFSCMTKKDFNELLKSP